MSKFSWVFSVIFPGIGQAICGRLWRGLLFIVLACVGVNLIVLGRFFSGESASTLFSSGLILFGCVWLLAIFEVFYFQHTYDPRKLEPELLEHIRRGMAYYLSSDHEAAKQEFTAVLKKAPNDIEANLYLAGVFREMGEKKKAMKQFKKVLILDDAKKWTWQVEKEMKLV